MAEAARAAVEHHEHLPGPVDAQGLPRTGIVEPAGGHDLDFEVMVARAERPELIRSSRDRAVAHMGGVRARQAPAAFHSIQILRPSIPARDTPARALDHDPAELGF